jgi:hypothetical protein
MNEQEKNQVICALIRAHLELNTIRARDGVPYTRYGPSNVDEEYFSSVVDDLDEAVWSLTGLPAHCHPALYKQGQQ